MIFQENHKCSKSVHDFMAFHVSGHITLAAFARDNLHVNTQLNVYVRFNLHLSSDRIRAQRGAH